jgi:hypothetical protein
MVSSLAPLAGAVSISLRRANRDLIFLSRACALSKAGQISQASRGK